MITRKGTGILVLSINKEYISLQTADGYLVVQILLKDANMNINKNEIIFGLPNEQYIVNSKYSQQIYSAFNLYQTNKNQLPNSEIYKCKVKMPVINDVNLLFNDQDFNLNGQSIKFTQILIFSNQDDIVNIVYKIDPQLNITHTDKLQFYDEEMLLMFLYYCRIKSKSQNSNIQKDRLQNQTFKTINNIISPQLASQSTFQPNTLQEYQEKQQRIMQQTQTNRKILQQQNINSPMLQIVPDQERQPELLTAAQMNIITNQLNEEQTNMTSIQTQDYKSMKNMQLMQEEQFLEDKEIEFKAQNLITNQKATVKIIRKNKNISIIATMKKCCTQNTSKLSNIAQINLYDYPSNIQGLFAVSRLFTVYTGKKAYDIKRNGMKCAKLNCIDNFQIPSIAQINTQHTREYTKLLQNVKNINRLLQKKQYFVIEIMSKDRKLNIFGITSQEQYRQLVSQLE